MQYFVGLDLGQSHDFTALTILERNSDAYDLRHLERLRGEPYPAIVTHVGKIMVKLAEKCGWPQEETLPGLFRNLPVAMLAIDATGVGRAVVDMFAAAQLPCKIAPITITSGQSHSFDGHGGAHVPKKDLVASALVLLQTRRLRIAKTLPLVEVLVKELDNFRVRITPAANEVFGAWREGEHDDLVLSLSLAAWAAKQTPPPNDTPLILWPPPPEPPPKPSDGRRIEGRPGRVESFNEQVYRIVAEMGDD